MDPQVLFHLHVWMLVAATASTTAATVHANQGTGPKWMQSGWFTMWCLFGGIWSLLYLLVP